MYELVFLVLLIILLAVCMGRLVQHIYYSRFSPIYCAYTGMKSSPLRVKRVGMGTSTPGVDDMSFIIANSDWTAEVHLLYHADNVLVERIRLTDVGGTVLELIVQASYEEHHGQRMILLRDKRLLSILVNGTEWKDQLESFEQQLSDQIRAELMSVANPVLLRFNEDNSEKFPLIKMQRRTPSEPIENRAN
jgi:hypothetical protein